MASQTRRENPNGQLGAQHDSAEQPQQETTESSASVEDLFVDPMMGVALQMYVAEDVQDKDAIIEAIKVSLALSFEFPAYLRDFTRRNMVDTSLLPSVPYPIYWVSGIIRNGVPMGAHEPLYYKSILRSSQVRASIASMPVKGERLSSTPDGFSAV
jgi:hypothetical protein